MDPGACFTPGKKGARRGMGVLLILCRRVRERRMRRPGESHFFAAGAVACCLLAFLDRRIVVRYQFMGVHGPANMTWEKFGAGFFDGIFGCSLWFPPAPLVVAVLLVHGRPGGGRRDECPTGSGFVPLDANRLPGTARRRGNVALRCSPWSSPPFFHGSRVFRRWLFTVAVGVDYMTLGISTAMSRIEGRLPGWSFMSVHGPACWMTA
jgi:hypothetical protein